MANCVFFGGRNATASDEYEGRLIQMLDPASFDTHYAGTFGGSFFDYTPTFADVSSKYVPKYQYSDTVTSNVDVDTVEILEMHFTNQCRRASMFIGASQGGVIATQMAIQRARMGIQTTLILLSSSPTPWQLHQVKFLIEAKLLTVVATVGWYECYFGGPVEYNSSYDKFSVAYSLQSRFEKIGAKVVLFNGGHCKETEETFGEIVNLLR